VATRTGRLAKSKRFCRRSGVPNARWRRLGTASDHMIDQRRPYDYTVHMGEAVKRITVNIPAKLLSKAQDTTGLGITETLIMALEELDRANKRSALRALRGRIKFELDLEKTRR
jgi:hypothetical protein